MIQKKYIIYGLLGIGTIVLIMTLIKFFSTGTLAVTAASKTPGNAAVSVTITRDSDTLATTKIQPGEKRKFSLNASTVRIDAKAGSLRAVDVVDVKATKTTTLTTPVAENRQAQQLASDTQDCPLIIAGVSYSYNCANQGIVMRHSATSQGNSLNTRLFGQEFYDGMKPFGQGLLAFHTTLGEPTPLIFINVAAETWQQVALTPSIKKMILDGQRPDIVTPPEAGSTTFALVFNQSNVIYLFDSLDDTDPVAIRPSKAKLDDTGRSSSASFADGTLVVYLGSVTASEAGEGKIGTETGSDEDTIAELPNYIFEYNQKGKLTRTIQLEARTDDSRITKISDTFYIGEKPYQVGFYAYQDDKLVPVYNLEDAGSWVTRGANAYIQADGVLYEFKAKSSTTFSLHGLFSNPNVTVSSIYNGPDGLLFSGFNPRSGTEQHPTNIYKLLPKGQEATSTGTPAVSQVEPTYSGLTQLIDVGLTSTQINNLKFALGMFIPTTRLSVTSVRVQQAAAEPHDSESANPIDRINFDLTLNGVAGYRATVIYDDLTAVQLIVKDFSSGTVLFDSGRIPK